MQDELTAGYRALCLGALLLRAQVEYMHAEPEGFVERLGPWLDEEGITEHISAEEWRLLSLPTGTWTHQERIDVSWRIEALGMIAWALSIIPIAPPYDHVFTPRLVMRPLGLLQPTGDFFKMVELRSEQTIEWARHVAELWHWRARTNHIQEKGIQPPGELSFSQIVARTARIAHEHGDLGPPLSNDFMAYNKPYRLLTDEEFATARSIAMERHYALNWLCGLSDDWDNVPTDT